MNNYIFWDVTPHQAVKSYRLLENRSSFSIFRVKQSKNRGQNIVAHIPSVSIKDAVDTLHGICKRAGHFDHPIVLQRNPTAQPQRLV